MYASIYTNYMTINTRAAIARARRTHTRTHADITCASSDNDVKQESKSPYVRRVGTTGTGLNSHTECAYTLLQCNNMYRKRTTIR